MRQPTPALGACGLLLSAALTSAALGQSTLPSHMLSKVRKQLQAEIDRVKPLAGTYKVSDLCQVVQEKGQYGLKVNLPADTPEEFRVEIAGLSGTSFVTRGANAGRARTFTLHNVRLDDPSVLEIDTNVSAAGNFSISRQWQLHRGYREVSLAQTMELAGKTLCRVVVLNVGEVGVRNAAAQGMSLRFPDMATMRTERPAEVEQYVRPLLRDVQLEYILAPEPMLLWQVFPDAWTPPQPLVQQVKSILPRLDADEYTDREKALKELQALGEDAALVIRRMDRKALTPQQSTLLDTLLASFLILSPDDLKKLRADGDFLLDCLYSDDPAARQAAFAAAKSLKQDLKFDAGEGLQQRIDAVRELRQQLGTASATQPSGK